MEVNYYVNNILVMTQTKANIVPSQGDSIEIESVDGVFKVISRKFHYARSKNSASINLIRSN